MPERRPIWLSLSVRLPPPSRARQPQCPVASPARMMAVPAGGECRPKQADHAPLKTPRRFSPIGPPDCVRMRLANAPLSLPRSGQLLAPTGRELRQVQMSRLHRIASARVRAPGYEVLLNDCRHRVLRRVLVD